MATTPLFCSRAVVPLKYSAKIASIKSLSDGTSRLTPTSYGRCCDSNRCLSVKYIVIRRLVWVGLGVIVGEDVTVGILVGVNVAVGVLEGVKVALGVLEGVNVTVGVRDGVDV